MIRVVEIGDPLLKKKSQNVTKFDPNLKSLISSMIDYGKSVSNCIGLAACQAGKLMRVSVINIDGDWEAIINPKILYKSGDMSTEWEGCMSLKDGNLFGKVKRSKSVIVEYYDEYGKRQVVKYEGLFSHLIQHEIDHMDGFVFLDRMKDPKNLLTDHEIEAMIGTDKK